MTTTNVDVRLDPPTKDIHIKDMPTMAWQIAKGAATIEGISVGLWVAKAILEKWGRKTNWGSY